MYAFLLDRAAEDVEAGGPVATVLAGHEDDPGPSALALRMLGSVHRLVLERRAGDLATYYPSVGGAWQPDGGWLALRRFLAEQPDAVREWLDRPPQTNEVGRATALFGGMLHLPRDLPVRLFEIGSSGGLNLLADRFTYVDEDGTRFGSDQDELVLAGAWKGRRLEPWPGLRVVERLGCDPLPVDPTTPEGRLVLTAYVWPDQQPRLQRLRAALRLAQRTPVQVRRQDARTFVGGLTLEDGTTTVLWHSVMWQYLSAEEQAAVAARVEELGGQADRTRRFAHLRAEPMRRGPADRHEFLVRLRIWPDGADRLLGATEAHGVPTTWE
jgi:hypothetical protein